MTFFARAQLMLGLLPGIIAAIKAVEEAIPGSGHGEQKLAAVRGALEAAYAGATDAIEEFEQLWPSLAGIIKTLVGIFNLKGIFKKG
jgi:hypothetical protein